MMMLFNDMYCFVLFVLIPSVCSWPVLEVENGPDLNLALSSQPENSSTNRIIITEHTIQISKIMNTTLGGIAFLFTSIIYFFLMRYNLTSSNEIILPSKYLADNIGGILSSAWLADHSGPGEGRRRGPVPLDKWKLLLKCPDLVERRAHVLDGMGYRDEGILKKKDEVNQPEVLGFKIFSPIMRSLIQIAIWNSASVWILLIAISNTLLYNGFFTNNITTDGIIRLSLIGSYSVANIAHYIRCNILLYRNFSFIIYQASWTVVFNDFLVLSVSKRSPVLVAFNLQLLGTTERSNTYDQTEDQQPYVPRAQLEEFMKRKMIQRGESGLDKFIKPQRETELKACEKATDSALERTLANIAVLVGICLAAALAPWTSLQASNSTSAQLGSYALLVSISTGLLALVSSVGHLSNATESARKLLEYQECATMSEYGIQQLTSGYELSEHLHRPGSGFFSRQQGDTQDPPGYPLTFWGHLKSIKGSKRFLGLLLGPALMLVPRLYGIRQPVSDTARQFNFTVSDEVNDLKFSYNSEEVPHIFRVDPNA